MSDQRGDGAEAGKADPEQQGGQEREEEDREHEGAEAGPDVPLPAVDRLRHARLERAEALAVRRAALRDPVPELRQALGSVGEHVVHDVRDRLLERGEPHVGIALADLQVGHRLAAEASPLLLVRRHGRRLVAPAPEQVEQRRRELERARVAVLAQQGRYERGLEVRGRLLLVLAVVLGLPLAPGPPPDGQNDRERRQHPEGEQEQGRPAHVLLRVVDPAAIAREALVVGPLLAKDPLQGLPLRTCAPAVEVRRDRGKSTRSSTNCPAGTSSARRSEIRGSLVVSPRTQAGWPKTR